jgi:hypothetical protein
MTDHRTDGVSRRDLIKTIAVAGAGMGLAHLGLPGDAGAEPVRLLEDAARPVCCRIDDGREVRTA